MAMPRSRSSSKSAWARDTQPRFLGYNSFYKPAPAASPPKQKLPPIIRSPGHGIMRRSNSDAMFSVDALSAYIKEEESHLNRMKALLIALAPIKPPATPPPHEAVAGGDALVEVLSDHLPAAMLGRTAQVSSAWREASSAARDRHGVFLNPWVLCPMFKAIPTLCQLMRLSAVCTVWRAAAASERAQWSKAVMVEHEARLRAEYVGGYDEPGLEISQVPFVDKLIRVSTLCGLEVVSTGGILATVQRVFDLLCLTQLLDGRDRRALTRLPNLTLIAAPEPGEHVPPEEMNDHETFIVGGVEHISPRVRALVDILAIGLQVVFDEETESRFALDGPTDLTTPEEARNLIETFSSVQDLQEHAATV